MMLTLVLLGLSSTPAPDAAAVQAARATALQNALRGIDLLAAARQPAAQAEPVRRCAIRLVEIPADRSIDPKIILRIPPDSAAIRMPVYEGLPPCPRTR
jgi:hypothetical protein